MVQSLKCQWPVWAAVSRHAGGVTQNKPQPKTQPSLHDVAMSPSLPCHPSNALHSHSFFYAVYFSVLPLHEFTFFYSHFRMHWHRQAFATSNKRSKSFSVNVFMPEVFRVCIITLLMSYLKRYIFCLNIYYSPSESLQDAERKCISWHKRQSSEVPYLHLQESHP